MMNTIKLRHTDNGETGQASVILVFMLGSFLLAMFAFAVDLTNMWFHKQATQTAADAACQAGAMDMLAVASGVTPPVMGFTYTITTATSSDCVASSTATICKYAGFNGYNGAGFSSSSASNSVSWTFPAAVTGATGPPAGVTSHPFLKVTVKENVKTWFMALLGFQYQAVAATCTCGLSEVLSDPPVVVLNPTGSGSLSYSGGGATLAIVGGPQRSIQVNSTSSTAVKCSSSGTLKTLQGGPNFTGGDIGVTGGPATMPSGSCWGGGINDTGLNLGTGVWRSPSLPVIDPYAGVPAPTMPAAGARHTVNLDEDGCPDNKPTNWPLGCLEYEPGYYASGINESANDVVIFKPGIYYMNGSFSMGGSDEIRLATPCTPKCSAFSSTAWTQTDGVMFYFVSGSFNIAGGGGVMDSTRVKSINSTSLTCNGSAPTGTVGLPSTLDGNILVAQCSTNGTYVGAGSTDTVSSSGSRGLLVYMAHTNPSAVTFGGSGKLGFSGSVYAHTTDSKGMVDVSGGSGTNTFVLGEIVSDNISLTGSGVITMALNPNASVNMVKVSILQ